MKVLLFARDFAPAIGGVQNLLARFSETFDPAEIHVLTCKSEGWRAHDASVSYAVTRMPSFESLPKPIGLPLRAVVSLWYVLRLVIAEKPELMVCGYVKGNAPYGWLVKKLFGIAYVVFAYGTDVVRYRGKGALIRFWLTGAKVVAAISEPVHRFVEEFTHGKANVITVPLGCGISGAAPDPALKKWGDVDFAGRWLLISVCRLTVRKGVDKTIEAVALLQKAHPELLYVVVGDGDDRSRLDTVAQKAGVDDSVVFAGRVSDDDLLRFYDRADALILASREEGRDIEGFGLVFVEAGAFGKPVIGGDSGGIRQAVGHEQNGLLVDSSSPKAIADAIERLMTDSALAQRLGTEGRRRATEEFTWENCRRVLFEALDRGAL